MGVTHFSLALPFQEQRFIVFSIIAQFVQQEKSFPLSTPGEAFSFSPLYM